MKKFSFFIIILLLIFPFSVSADSASSTIVMDTSSGRVLYSNNSHDKRLIASITKIMTCLVVLENNDLDEVITVGDEVLSMYGTNIYIEDGEKLTIRDLLYGLMLRSGNDAAITLAVQTEGSEEAFVEKMNKKAKEIGMKDTSFSNSHGLDEDTKNYSTAYDMALLGRYVYQNKNYRKIISTKKYNTKSSLKTYVWYNRMMLLSNYKNCVGGKNGYTPKAGKTLVSYAKDNDLTLMIVTLNDGDLYNNHKRLYNKYFEKYKNYTILDKNNFFIPSYFQKKEVYIKNSFSYPLKEDEVDLIKTMVSIYKSPSKGNVVGDVSILLDKEKIGNTLIYQKSIKKEENSFFQKFKELFLR